ncbi:MAG TPA: signal peptidase I [Candidatus Paceibacterota bacterium]|nr:signal peptidase I [Candidatus Pacearchaeota archaeon]HRZ50714.1 signal peptidase I [Candidatus Paceibacterota bacterium]HSA36389.1 signal peptidase I [Candidatus Paceibacterota bacterium]
MNNTVTSTLVFFIEVAKIVILAFAIVVPIRYYLFQPFVIQGSSMEPNFHQADYLIVDEFSYRLRAPERGEVIVFKYPLDPSKRFIKRIIGLPGETVETEGGKVIVYSNERKFVLDESAYLSADLKVPDMSPITLKDGQYFVLGDNRSYSYDSQDWGELAASDIIGKVAFRLWPINTVQKISSPTY